MEKFNNMQKNELKDTEMEEVTGGSLTEQIIRRQKFQQEKEEQKKRKNRLYSAMTPVPGAAGKQLRSDCNGKD